MKSIYTNKLKLLFVCSDKFPPFRVDVSVLFGKEIVNRGHAIDWLFQSSNALRHSYQTQWFGGKALIGRAINTDSSMITRVMNQFYAIMHDFRVFGLLKRSRYDFIVVRDKFISGLIPLAAAKLRRTKIIYWLSYPFPEAALFRVREHTVSYPMIYRLKGYIFHFLLYCILLRLSEHVFVQTEEMLKNVASKGISKAKLTAVPMAVSIKDIPFFGYEHDRRLAGRDKILVYLGTLMRTRKMDFLLRVLEMILKEQRNVRLYLVGGSENAKDEELLMHEAKRLRIEHAVTITGFRPQNEAWQYVKNADVCLSPIYPAQIWNWGSPTKLLEYLAMGKASVANDHPEQRQVIAESKAGICVPYEETAFAEAILYLLKNPDVARQMGFRGRKYIEKKRNYEQAADVVEKKLLEISKITNLSYGATPVTDKLH